MSSFLARIAAAVAERPDAPIPTALLISWATPMSVGDDDRPVLPGVRDAMAAGAPDTAEATDLARRVLDDVEHGRVTSWRAIDQRLREVRIAGALRPFLEALEPDQVRVETSARFWETARASANEESVKWGILLGCLHPTEAQIADLLLFARHPEFTRYAVPPLRAIAERVPDVIDDLYGLVPRVSGYALGHLVRGLLAESEHAGSTDRSTLLVVHAMERGIKAELGVPLALDADLAAVCETAEHDPRVRDAVIMLMNTLLYDSDGYPAERWGSAVENLYRRYVRLLRRSAPSIQVASALQALVEFLEDASSEGMPDRDWRRDEIGRLAAERVDPDTVARALADPHTRSLALHVIEGQRLTVFVPRIVELVAETGDVHAAHVAAALGAPEGLDALRELLPSLVDLEARREAPMRRESRAGLDDREHRLYAIVVAAMGRLATPEAVELVKRAARDVHPWGRAAACEAIADLPASAVDAELRALVRERAGDNPDFVAAEARRAADAHGIEVSRAADGADAGGHADA